MSSSAFPDTPVAFQYTATPEQFIEYGFRVPPVADDLVSLRLRISDVQTGFVYLLIHFPSFKSSIHKGIVLYRINKTDDLTQYNMPAHSGEEFTMIMGHTQVSEPLTLAYVKWDELTKTNADTRFKYDLNYLPDTRVVWSIWSSGVVSTVHDLALPLLVKQNVYVEYLKTLFKITDSKELDPAVDALTNYHNLPIQFDVPTIDLAPIMTSQLSPWLDTVKTYLSGAITTAMAASLKSLTEKIDSQTDDMLTDSQQNVVSLQRYFDSVLSTIGPQLSNQTTIVKTEIKPLFPVGNSLMSPTSAVTPNGFKLPKTKLQPNMSADYMVVDSLEYMTYNSAVQFSLESGYDMYLVYKGKSLRDGAYVYYMGKDAPRFV